MTPVEMCLFLVVGYVVTVSVELPVLYFGLASRHSPSERLMFAFILTAFTYPIVILVMPVLLHPLGRLAYVGIAELFAPLAEVALFRFFDRQKIVSRLDRDAGVIVFANVLSFLLGEAFLTEWIVGIIQVVK